MNEQQPNAGGTTRGGTELLERAEELSTIARAISDVASGSGRLVIVEGEAGIGKTALLRASLELPTAEPVRSLWASGSELEQLHPFGVATQLLTPLVREAGGVDALRGPAAPARAVFEGRVTRGSEQADPLTILHAAFWLILDASERRPLLLAVDDAHWADEPSLRLLAYVAHRITSLPVTLLVGTRPTASVAPEVSEQIRSHRDATRLILAQLTPAGVATLIQRTPTTRHPSPEAIWSQAGGNPFYVVELLRALPVDEEPAGHDVPDTIRASIRRRLTASGPMATAVAEAIAVLGDDADLATVSRLAAVSQADAAAAIRATAERAILTRDQLTYTHPIVRTTVMDFIPDAVRPQLHRRAADILHDVDRPATAVATHLLNSTPAGDARVVTMLREAAGVARAQGDPAAAASFLARALREPPADEDRGQLLLDLAKAEAAVGMPSANEHFEEAVARLRQPHERAQARLAQGHALIQSARWTEGAAAFDAGLAEVDPRDVELKSRLEAGFVSSAYVGLTDREEANRRLERILAAPLHDPAHRELAAWTAFQHTMAVTTRASEAAALARRSLSDASLEELITTSQVVELVAGVLVATGDVLEEIALLDEAIQTARRLNAHQKIGIYSYCRSLPHLAAGRIADAIADAETALAVHEYGWEIFYPGTCAALAWAHLERDDVAAAARALVMDDAKWEQRLDYQFMVRIARGRLRSAVGDSAGAIEQFHLARDAGQVIGVRTASVLADWRTWCAVELARSGDREVSVALAEEALAIARTWGAPFGVGRAHWALGVAVGGREGVEHLQAAADELANGPLHLEATRALVDLGAALRRAGRTIDARDALRRAADMAHRMGATTLGRRAMEELAAAGSRPRRYAVSGVGSLTPSELRVARLAAEGRTNREVAQVLFVTPKAVEYHLANAYRKLEIDGRSELARALAAEAVASV